MSTDEKIVYLARHGESVCNTKGVVQDSEGGLTILGREQAYYLGRRFARKGIERILTSFDERAHATAIQASGFVGASVFGLHELHEARQPSHLVGISVTDEKVLAFKKKREEAFSAGNVRIYDEETFCMLHGRALYVAEFLRNMSHRCVLVISHGVFLTYLINTLQHGHNLTPEIIVRASQMFENTGVVKAVYGQHTTFTGPATGWRLWPGDTSHLE
ncbi:hypothetical protein A3C87_02080 [Candidatus Kaiserbacteria bacterium RIFCSPHIGHO2_02_FULL_49_34]|uniref:Phosphoglycerate mutase n=1 Tax=Candidatus Kaiserbacteria bacterium RIFCSPHIGHO2_02_FULL_49_34 TaxID=1798491 RepID=A0A1F6DI60_9BACT|nr:MAG: hypothetical protein A3C87_02080 [Candidatus Kaiserbacteria bacterium RIFCSPHIGHO2_02_FULL_49_34]